MRALAALLFLLCAACGPQEFGHCSGCADAPAILIGPGDQLTQVARSPVLNISLFDNSRTHLEMLLEKVIDAAALTSADGTRIPISGQARALTPVAEVEKFHANHVATLDFAVKAPLATGAYEWTVSAEFVRLLVGRVEGHRLEDGRLGSRFSVGGTAGLRDVRFCHNVNDRPYGPYVAVSFSEEMSLAPGKKLADGLRLVDAATGAVVPCAATAGRSLVGSPAKAIVPGVYSATWWLICDAEPLKARLEITDQVVNVDGVAMAPTTQSFTLNQIVNGCWTVTK